MSDPVDSTTTQVAKPPVLESGLEILEEKVVSTTLPGQEGTGMEQPATKYTVRADPSREYVAGGGWSWYNNAIRTLPWSIDDISDDFGDDIYEQMMRDPTIISCINVLKTAILSAGVHIQPYQASSTEPVPPLASEMSEFVARVIDDLETPIDDVLWNMLDALAFGNKVAELVFIIAYRTRNIQVEVEEDLTADESAQDDAEQSIEQQRRLSGIPGEEDLKKGSVKSIKKPLAQLPADARKAVKEGTGGMAGMSRPKSALVRLARRVYMALNPNGKPEDVPEDDQQAAPVSGQSGAPGDDTDPTNVDANLPVAQRTSMETVQIQRPMLELRRIKVKPRRSTAFIVDPFLNVIGILGLLPGQFNAVMSGSMFISPEAMPPNVLPRAKFAVLTFRPKDSDPRGSSILRPAYNAWWLKRQTWPEYLRYLAQFASATLLGFTAPDEEFVPVVDDQGMSVEGSFTTAEQSMLAALLKVRNGSAAVFKNGSDVKPLGMQGDGAAFRAAIELFNTEMVTAVLHQKLAIMDSEHNTRAAASVHQDTLQTIIRQARKAVERMLRSDIIMPLIRFNFGEDACAWAPEATLGETEQTDFAAIATAVAALMKAGFFDPSQMQELDTMLGLPPRPQASVDQQAAAKKSGYMLASKVASGEISLDANENGVPDDEE